MNIHDSNLTLPRPEGEPIMHSILVVGMVIMILVAILSAYMDAMLYLRSHQAIISQATNNQTNYQASNHHNNKDRSSGGGHGAAASTISTTINNHQQQNHQHQTSSSSPLSSTTSSLPYISIANGNGIGKNNINLINNKSNNGNSKNTCTQKRRKSSSTVNSEKVPTNNTNKSIKPSTTITTSSSSSSSSATTSSPYTPIFQNLTNVIASPPPPLPAFDSEFNSLEFKKIKGTRDSTKKSNSLNGSVASSTSSDERRFKDPIGDQRSAKMKRGGDMDDRDVRRKSMNPRSLNGVCDKGDEDTLEVDYRELLENSDKKKLKTDDADRKELKHKESKDSRDDNSYQHHDDNNDHHIHNSTPSSLTSSTTSTSSSASSSSSTSSTPPLSASSSSSTSSSTSSSPPLSASSYGEYSLLGPGASFELPCLRVRSNNTMIM